MKISVIITTILVAQVSATFFDVFQGAVLSVQNSFGKLLSDVVTDVKDTVDCTILAVEHVLSLSRDATTRYYEKCGSVTNKTDSVSNARQDASLPKVEVTLNLPNNEEYLQKLVPAEIDARINETLSKVLGDYKTHESVLSIENVLAKESEQLAGVSLLVKQELEKLSHEVSTDLKNMEKQRDLQPSVDGILQEIRILEKREQSTKNASEANEIHQVIDEVLGKLHAIEATEATENMKLEAILKGLERNANNSFVGLRHQFEEWKEEESRHLNEIRSKMEEHENISDHPGSYNRHGSNLTEPVIVDTHPDIDDNGSKKNTQIISSENTTQFKETVGNSMSSRIIGYRTNKSLVSVENEPSFSRNRLNESGLNDTVTESSLYITTEIPYNRDLIYQTENQSSTPNNNLTGIGTNETMANNTSITDSAPVNETIPVIYFLKDLNKRELTAESTNKPTSILAPHANLLGDISQPVFEEMSNYGTVITSAAERTEAELRSSTQDSVDNNNLNKMANTSIIANTMIENTTVNETHFKNLVSSTLPTNMFATNLAIFNSNESKDTMMTSTPASINVSIPVNDIIRPVGLITTLGNVESSTVTTRIVSDNNSNEIKIRNTSLFTIESAQVSEIMKPIETTTVSNNEESTKTIVQDDNLNDTIIVASTPITENMNEGKTASGSVESAIVTMEIVNYSDSNKTMITSDSSSPIVGNLPVSKTIVPDETTMTLGNEKYLKRSDETMITRSPLSIIETTTMCGTIQAEKNNTASGNEESAEAITELTTTSHTVNENYSATTSIPTPVESTSETDTIQDKYTTTVSNSEETSISSTTSRSTETPKTADDDTSPTTIISMTKTTSEHNYMTTDSEEPPTTFSPIDSPAKLITTDSNADVIITSTPCPMTETTTVSDKIEPFKSTTTAENEEPSILSTTPATILAEVTINENNHSNDTVTITTEQMDSTAVTETNQTVETTSASEGKGLFSTSTSTQSAINEIVTGTEISIMASRNEEDLRNSPKLEAQEFSPTTKILNSPDLNFMISSPPLTITENPGNRGWLKHELPMYKQTAVPTITRGLFNDAPQLMTPDSVIPNYENPSNLPTSLHRIRPPYFLGDRDPAYTYRPEGLTTQKPGTTARANNDKTPSMDYDSFFHSPQKDSEAHQRAVQEARQLIANSRKSRRILNSIMKNKKKFNARSVLNG